MDSVGIGPAELVLIALIVFVVLGPERLPTLMHTLGKWIYQLRQTFQELGEMNVELNTTTQELRAVRQDLQDLSRKFSYQLHKELEFAPQNSAYSASPLERTAQAAEGGLPPLRSQPDALASGDGCQTNINHPPGHTAHQSHGPTNQEGIYQ